MMMVFNLFIESVSACTTSASTIFAHYELALLQVCFGHTAYAGSLIVGVLLDDTRQTTQFFKAWLLPFCYQICIRILLVQEVLI